MQEDIGLRSVNDGEFRRGAWHMNFIYQLDGVTRLADEKLEVEFRSDEGEIEAVLSGRRVDGRLGLFAFLREAIDGD